MIPISVVMPTYNTPAAYLKEAAESILNQTFSDFEFIIVDDGSTLEEAVRYLGTIKDPRVRIIRNRGNLGITKSLNVGFKEASGKYIARMDDDDISLPERFEKQYAFMEAHPDAVLCGTYAEYFGEYESIRRCDIRDPERFRISLFFENCGPSHPSVMFRKDALIKNYLLYDERIRYAQDYMMWVNATRIGRVYCMEEVLVRYRVHKTQVSLERKTEQQRCHDFVLREQLKCLLKHADMCTAEKHRLFFREKALTDENRKWFMRLITANDKKRVYDKDKFREYVWNIVAGKVLSSYSRYDPRLYVMILKNLPAPYILSKVKKRILKRVLAR